MSRRPSRRCAQAQEALRQALERGASDEELKKLMDQLRAAHGQVPAGAGRGDAQESAAARAPARSAIRACSASRISRACSTGWRIWRAPATRMPRAQLLEQLQSMLENLQMARPGAQMRRRRRRHDVGARRTGRHDPQAAAVARQDLQTGPGPAARPQSSAASRAQQGEQMGDLQQDQQALRDRLNKLLEQLRKRGSAIGQQGQGRTARASRARARWISSARPARPWARPKANSARAMPIARSTARAARWKPCARARKASRSQMQQQRQAWARVRGQPGRRPQRAQQDTDPLGRPLRGRDYGDDVTVKVPGEIDVQRARRILEELRKRFGESLPAAARARLYRAIAEGFLSH